MSKITPGESLNLKKLLKDAEAVDNTEFIRKVRHSEKIRDDIRKIDTLKNKNKDIRGTEKFVELARREAPFLFNNYTDIFNKLVVDELDLAIMSRLLTIIKMIEDNKVDQHEGSVLVGKILKELYVDSALKRAEHLDQIHQEEVPKKPDAKPISWAEYKKTNKQNVL